MDTIEDGTPVTPPVTQHRTARDRRPRPRRVMALMSAVVTTAALTLVGSALPAAAAGTTWYADQANGTDGPSCGASQGADACGTIGAALARAGDGDTVSVAPGTYSEALTISDAITLQGTSQGDDGVVLSNPSTDNATTITIDATGPVTVSTMEITPATPSDTTHAPLAVQVQADAAATLSHISVTNPTEQAVSGISAAGGSSLSVEQSTVTGVAFAVSAGDPPTTDSAAVPATLTVTGSSITGNSVGIMLAAGTATVTGGTISGNFFAGLAGNTADVDFEVTDTAITANGQQSAGWDSAGVTLRAGGTFTGNGVTLSDNYNAVSAMNGGTITLTDSTVTGNGGLSGDGTPVGHGIFARVGDAGGDGGAGDAGSLSVTLSGTEVSDNTAGLELSGARTSITNSTIADNAMIGILVRPEPTAGPAAQPAAADPAAESEDPDTPALTLTGSTVTGNGPESAAGAARFLGGLAVSGLDAVLTDTDVTDNTVGISADGNAQITVTGGSVAGNAGNGITLGGTPGGVDPAIDLTGTAITGNGLGTNGSVVPPAGIAVSGGTVTGEQVTVSGNGNGILTLGSNPVTVHLTDSVVSGSTAVDSGSQLPTGSGIVVAGGAYQDGTGSSRVTLMRTEVSNNDANGLWLLPGSVTTVTDSTIAGNAIGVTGLLPDGASPGEVPPAGLLLAGSTVAGNTGNAMVVAAGLGVTVGGSILQAPDGVSACTSPGDQTLIDGGWNLASDDSCGLTADSSSVGDAQLGVLADNGGPTRTMLPDPTSPAINAVDVGASLGQGDEAVTLCGGVVDQRGTARPQGSACDAGAVERTSGLITVTASDATLYEGGATPTVAPSYSGFTGTDTVGDLTTPASCGYDQAAGTTSCHGAADDFYDFHYVPGVLTVLQPPRVTTTDLPQGWVEDGYSLTLKASGGATPLSWSITDGALPAGLHLASSTGAITGTPHFGGIYQFTVTASDANDVTDAQDLTLTITAPACTEPPFPDVPVDSPYCPAVAWITDRGITTGYTDGNFHPERQVTRQTMAGFLYRYVHDGAQAPACDDAPFDDVPTSNPFCGAITWLVGQEITTGYGDGTFRPTEPVTNQTMAAFLYRLGHDGAQAPACDSAPFSDVPVGNPFCGAITWVSSNGIAIGDADGFHPADIVTRGPMAADLYYYDQYQAARTPR